MGQLLSNGLGIDDVYLAVNLPQAVLTDGLDTFNCGISGVASWGPFNIPVSVNTPQDLIAAFGPPINTGKDLVQDGVLFLAQRPQGGVTGIRVGDGTQTKAFCDLKDTSNAPGLHLVTMWPGTFGNGFHFKVVAGSNSQPTALTYQVQIFSTKGHSQVAEVFDKIPAGGTPGTDDVWVNMMNAINAGSQLVVASLPTTPSVALPALAAQVMGNQGTDGVTGVVTATQIGTDGSSGQRTGIYAMRGLGLDLVFLAGNTDVTAWALLDAFAISENCMALSCIDDGQTVGTAISEFITAGVADANFHCSWGSVTYLDTFLNVQVKLPQTSVIAGICGRVKPSDSPGNQPAYGIIGTNLTLGANPQPLSFADMSALEANGIGFLCNPIPSGNVIGLRHGKNTSPNAATNEVAYTRKLNQILRDLSGPTLGQFVNKKQTTHDPDATRTGVVTALTGYFSPQKAAGEIDDFSVQCNMGNNPVSQIQAGVLTATVVVVLMAIVNRFIVNITAGQTVSIQNSSNINTGG